MGSEEPIGRALSERSTSLAGTAWLFPVAIVIMVAVLGVLRINGSSLSVYATELGSSEEQAGVLTGPARPIRSDEWLVRTPWVMQQVELGLPERVAGGVGVHDVAVLSDLPTAGWEVLLRPHTLAYRFLDVRRAFAVEWWTLHAVQLLGVYAFLFAVTRRASISALAASILTLSPATQWWAAPGTFTTIGYGSLAAALFLFAFRASTHRRRVGLSAATGLAVAAFLTALYVPWQIGTALVVVPVAVGALVPDLRDAVGWRRVVRRAAGVLLVGLGLGGGLFAIFVLSHRQAVTTISSTVYPGGAGAHEGGGVPFTLIWGSAFDYFSSEKPFALVNGTNQSENSSGLPFLVPVALGCIAHRYHGHLRSHPLAYPLIGSLVGGGVMAAWMLLPIPAQVGQLLLLTRVAPSRLLLPVAFAGVVALALFASFEGASDRYPRRWQLVGSVCLFAAAAMWCATAYEVDGKKIALGLAAVFVIVITIGVALSLGPRPLAGLAILVLFSLWQASLINPLQQGTSPLTGSALRDAVEKVSSTAPASAGWIAYAADAKVRGTLTAAGTNNLSGVSPYPDWDAWRILDPTMENQTVWNRYAHVSFLVGQAGSRPRFALISPDSISVTIDPCSPALTELGVGFFVTQGFEMASCVRPVLRVRHGSDFVVIYRRTAPTA